MTTIEPGIRVQVRTADDRMIEKRALTEIVRGNDFPVVWVCRDDEWANAAAEGRQPVGVPWPAEAVSPIS